MKKIEAEAAEQAAAKEKVAAAAAANENEKNNFLPARKPFWALCGDVFFFNSAFVTLSEVASKPAGAVFVVLAFQEHCIKIGISLRAACLHQSS